MSSLVVYVLLLVVNTVAPAAVTTSSEIFNPDSSAGNFSRAVRTRNPLYGPWLSPSAIPYRISSDIGAADQTTIITAMNTISTNMGGCIRFVPYAAGAGDFLQISSTLNNGSSVGPTCFSFPGRVLRQAGNGQKLGMITGVDGCLDGTRSAMKYLAHALGLRNEYNRPDRTSFITMAAETVIKPALQGLGLTAAYLTGSNSPLNVEPLTSFDIKSITMINPTKYVSSGSFYTVIAPGSPTVGNLAALSVGDCMGLKSIYLTCLSVTCNDPYAGQLNSIPTSLAAGVTQAGSGGGTVSAGTPGGSTTITGTVLTGAPIEPAFPGSGFGLPGIPP